MALIVCPECGKNVSDKSISCIHCGYPLSKFVASYQVQHAISSVPSKEEIKAMVFEADNLRINGNYTKALTLYEKAGELGNVHSQTWAGVFYERAIGISADYTKALFWYQQAANHNDKTALNNLGMMYQKGNGVPQNITKAIELYKRASSLGSPVAAENLGILYEDGIYVEKNLELTAQYYSLAVELGSTNGVVINNLAVSYMDAKGVEQDYSKAEELLLKAISLGNEKAKENLKILQARVSKPITTPSSNQQNQSKEKWWLVLVIVLALLGFLTMFTNNGNDGNRTCPMCNGTGYNGNGAKNVTEYVFKKTPCTWCDGTGTY